MAAHHIGQRTKKLPRCASESDEGASAAGAKQEPNPITELRNRVSKLLGRQLTRKDVIYKYEVSAELRTEGNSEMTGMLASAEAEDARTAKRLAAAALLKDLDKVDATAKPTLNAFEVGQELEGTVMAISRKGVRVDIGATTDAYLPAAEVGTGFPVAPEVGSTVKVRVLRRKPCSLTMRDGDLEREDIPQVPIDSDWVEAVEQLKMMDATVIGLSFREAVVKVICPFDSSRATPANLPWADIDADFRDKIAIGSDLKVRKKEFKKGKKDFLKVTMRERPAVSASSLTPGQSLTGIVDSVRAAGQMQGTFLDIGADVLAFLDWQEYGDGYNSSTKDLRFLNEVEVRVLRVETDPDKIWLTRRTGSIERPEDVYSENSDETAAVFRSLSADQWMDATVLKLFKSRARVKVTSPDGSVQAGGYVYTKLFTENFFKEAAPGVSIRVRLRNPEQPFLPKSNYLALTMLPEEAGDE
eukprot:TRINITY_DN30057_c0_g1_i1.p1 TRINITY_DN30057_c0_g1~~TRINITY_DN30057_c0_g1_i1.p1  ORF type:complete len:518 (+),score=118.85 TRINITY_DN30057_c0_g1_i1:143-1555(+)